MSIAQPNSQYVKKNFKTFVLPTVFYFFFLISVMKSAPNNPGGSSVCSRLPPCCEGAAVFPRPASACAGHIHTSCLPPVQHGSGNFLSHPTDSSICSNTTCKMICPNVACLAPCREELRCPFLKAKLGLGELETQGITAWFPHLLITVAAPTSEHLLGTCSIDGVTIPCFLF